MPRRAPRSPAPSYGVLVREGMRRSEGLALTWADLDLERGVVRLDVNKTDDPRSWALGEDVTRALAAWRRLRGTRAEKVPQVFPKALVGHKTRLARSLRDDLTAAKVTRPELTVPKPGRMLLRVHDLRGSFVTLALRRRPHRGVRVTDRTGHRSSQMISTSTRPEASRTASELNLGWFAPLDEAIPELAPKRATGCEWGANAGIRETRDDASRIAKGWKTGSSRRARLLRPLLTSRWPQVRTLSRPLNQQKTLAQGTETPAGVSVKRNFESGCTVS